LTPALPLFHSFRNSFHSATPWALRMRADTGISFGARGTLEQLQAGLVRQAVGLALVHVLADQTRFSHVSAPPRERGTTWSRLPSVRVQQRPVYWQRLPSRSRMFGR
jgi:hypothetical protein